MREGICVVLLLVVGSAHSRSAPNDLPDAVLEIAHTRQHNRHLLDGLPAYTCEETIAREQKGPKQRKPRALDIVQVDVGVGQDTEIYSWPGEKAFSSSDLGALIGYGFFGNRFLPYLCH